MCSGRTFARRTSPPVMAAAVRKVPASMRSGMSGVLGAVQLAHALDGDDGASRRR